MVLDGRTGGRKDGWAHGRRQNCIPPTLSVITSTKQRIKCLAQGHNAVLPVRLETATPQSRIEHSTTEPPRSAARGHIVYA